MAGQPDRRKPGDPNDVKACEACPHCGAALSPWEQVLLSVDRAMMCKHCWYRIILDVREDAGQGDAESKQPKDPRQ
ncbi:MAG: hypothetical protein HYZ01_07860 [Ignavibacteriales bacterium]|nr:hypothetical protein [Ignavibacteriales bacterium]